MNRDQISYRQIRVNDADYAQTLPLRDRVLRQAWNTSIYDDDLSDEWRQYIWGAFDGPKLVGMAVLQDLDPDLPRLRYMAIDPTYQGRGIGRTIVQDLESYARSRGKEGIRLMARTSVLPFYEKLGYQIEGQAFIPDNIDLEHIFMVHLF